LSIQNIAYEKIESTAQRLYHLKFHEFLYLVSFFYDKKYSSHIILYASCQMISLISNLSDIAQ